MSRTSTRKLPHNGKGKSDKLVAKATSSSITKKDTTGLEQFVNVADNLHLFIQEQSTEWSKIHYSLTPSNLKELIWNLSIGISPIMSFASIGLTKSDYYNWLKMASEQKEPYSTLMKIVEIAQAKSCCLLHSKVLSSNSSSAKWLLERRFRDDYGQKTSTELTISQPLNQLTDEQLHQLLEEEKANQQEE